MRKTLMAVMVVAAWASQVSCGHKAGKQTRSRPLPATCRKLVVRHQHCLDALAVVAKERGTDLLVRTMTNLSAEERVTLRNELAAKLERDKADFRKLLARSVKDEFPAWCASAAASSKGRTLVSAMKACLGKPDCQTYAACIGGVLRRLAAASGPLPQARPAPGSLGSGAGTRDATDGAPPAARAGARDAAKAPGAAQAGSAEKKPDPAQSPTAPGMDATWPRAGAVQGGAETPSRPRRGAARPSARKEKAQ